MKVSAGHLALTVALSVAAPPCTAQDLGYAVGAGGWQLERFGADVAILRTMVTGLPPHSNNKGLLLLSCEGSMHRLRLELPDKITKSLGSDTNGRALIRAGSATPKQHALLANVSVEKQRVLTFMRAGPASNELILEFVRMLATYPTDVEILLQPGRGSVVLRRVVPLLLSLTYNGRESVAFSDFRSACSPVVR